jgi:biopolymer transport protein ExbD
MKLPRNAKIFRGQLDAAPFASVSFLLLLLILLHSKIVFNPGIQVNLPEAATSLPGTASPAVVVALDSGGQLYYEQQNISLEALRDRLRAAVEQSDGPITLQVQADRSASLETTVLLLSLAEEVGMARAHIVTRPKPEPIRRVAR